MKITDHNVFFITRNFTEKKKSKSSFHWFLLVSLHYDVAFSCCVGKLIISNTQTAHILFILFIRLVFKIGMSLYFAYTLACWLYIWKPNHQNNEYSTHNNAMSDLWASIKQSIWVNLSIYLYFFLKATAADKSGMWILGPHGELVFIWPSRGATGHLFHSLNLLSEHHLSVHPEQWLASV